MRYGWLATLLFSLTVSAQTASAPPPQAPSAPAQVYTNADLHVSFWYPAEMKPRDPKKVADASQRMIFGSDPDVDQKHLNAESCSKVLLSVGTEKSANPEGTISLFDISPGCVPADAAKNKKAMDKALAGIVTEGTTVLGMMPIEQPFAYPIEGHRVHFAASQGQPVTKTDLQTSEPQLRATIAVAVNGHILSWMFEAGDAEFFNRLLASPVDFGAGKAQPLFPLQFH